MIIASAVRLPDGQVFVGRRHGDAGRQAVELLGLDRVSYSDDGFITSGLRFLNREEALVYAKEHGQFRRYELWHNKDENGNFNGYDGDELFSEDLW
jgi:hypothetical protein